ncbi:MAG TPA: C25 family cysteine peptidase [Chitinophagaceae bacterium]|nr:C25 family cysteine peptidase [Chitinophagaceae bacterium]
MKRILLVLFVCSGLYMQAQTYNNEWIDYSKTYYKFKVGKTGLYRIQQAVLAGLGLDAVPAEQFQLWRNGKQIPLYTSAASGALGVSDYIEFWGEMNDGKPDNALYRNPDYQLNDQWSLQTDTAAYFLTVNPAGGNLRLQNSANNVAGNVLPAEPYFMYTAGTYFKNKINPGYAAVVGEYVYSASYDIGEGWTSTDVAPNAPRSVPFNAIQLYSAGPDARLKINLSGNAINPRIVRVRINGDSVLGKEMDYFDYIKIDTTIPVSKLAVSPNVALDITNLCSVNTDRMVIHKVELTYPRTFNFGGQKSFEFYLPANANGNFLQITNFSYGSTAPVLYDLTNGKRYVADISTPGQVKVVLQPSAVDRRLILVSEDASNVLQISSLEARNFVNYALPENQGDYLIISHPSLYTSSDGTNYVEAYRAYRSSAAGRNFNARVYDINELVDQFAYGIKKDPLSIRNFLRWARATYSTPIKDVLLIGHGMTYNLYRAYESNVNADRLNIVPTWGNPASDMLLSSTFENPVPQTPIGRLSVVTGDEINIYLQKLKEYEQAQATPSPLIQDKAWMKNVAHVVGASDDNLNDILNAYMYKYNQIISDTLFGANVKTFSKASTDQVSQTSVELANLFQEGLSMLLYFGHSASSVLQFNLDNPLNYNNPGKYPVMIMLGCNAGNNFGYDVNRFQIKTTTSENFILAPQRGSIGYLASTHFGIVHYLDIYNTKIYNSLSSTKYGQTFGEQIIEAIKQVYNLTSVDDYYARLHVEENCLNGDPAVKLNNFSKPDYVVEDPLVKITPNNLSVSTEKFRVDAKFLNIGAAINKNIVVEIKRQYPNGKTDIVLRDTIPGIHYADSVSIELPIVASRDKGLNKIIVTVDADNEVDELFENNNTITKDVYIYDNSADLIFPYKYAIVHDPAIKLIASTADPFSKVRQYQMEIDTTEKFNSALKQTQTVSAVGGILEFNPGISFSDSTVYYWRVGSQSTDGTMTWNTSSFIYITASSDGFNQSHYFQHLNSTLSNIKLDSLSRNWQFDSTATLLDIHNAVFPTSGGYDQDFGIFVNDSLYIGEGCYANSTDFTVFDPVTMKPWKNDYSGATGLYGSNKLTCGNFKEYSFEFSMATTASRKNAMDFFDLIPDGYYVIVRNNVATTQSGNTYPNVWKSDTTLYGSGNSLYHRIYNLGFYDLDSFYKPRAYLFIGKKNDQLHFKPQSLFSQGLLDKISLKVNCMTPDTLGYITSPKFGPAKRWKELHWRGSTQDTAAGDEPTIDVIGIKADGSQVNLFTGLDINQQDYDISSVDAVQYPYLQLRMRNLDSVFLTPYQLKYWRLNYDPVPEGALAPNLYFITKDTVEVGEPFNFGIAFKNISKIPFDSLKVKLSITDKNNIENIIPIPRQKALAPEDTVKIDAQIDTKAFAGTNILKVDFNPDMDQPEQYLFNNIGFRTLYVKPDSLNPLLDVTFDGAHILNRDIVSAKPQILIKLKDESKWLILDTSRVNIQVRYPDGSLRNFYFTNDSLKFTAPGAAPNPNNTASIDFSPYFTQDGEYELIVTGKDMSENSSGKLEYRVAFQVINKPMISNMLNYPNPFTTSTAFVFTITGSEVPQNIRIQIMTITGKIVREITKQELGPLHIGRNITEFKWDGTDQYGQKLANGIYLYRVITNLNGKSLDKYTAEGDNTDKYFNKGYGKMYLMR